jgi:DNA polymerase III alpha subunit (gram-positive type)
MQLIKLTFDAATVPVAEDSDAVAEQQTALAELSEVTQVTNSGEQDKAVRRARKAKILVQEAEKSRRGILKPIELLVDRINGIAKGYKAKLELEINRVSMMCTQFQKEEDERLAAAARARQAEIDRAERERIEQEQRLREAQEEAAAAKPDDREAQAMAELREQEAKEAIAAAQAKADAAIRQPEVERERASGQIVQDVVLYEVTDLRALYAARPDLVRLEENRSAIRAILSKDLVLPGVRVWVEKRVGVRA